MHSMTISCTRHFGNWERPALEWAAAWIVDGFADDSGAVDLKETRLVVPGKRAARMLIGYLVDLCAERELTLTPPLILTPNEIPAATLGPPNGEIASKLSKRIAWIETLNAVDPAQLTTLTPLAPTHDGWDRWASLAGWIDRVSSELSEAGLRMQDVIGHIPAELETTERTRWETLAELQSLYGSRLESLGLVDERLAVLDQFANAEHRNPADPLRLILIGLPELGSIARTALERSNCELDALVYAPESEAEYFDDLGCVDHDAWIDRDLSIDEDRIVFTPDTDSMCEHALASLADPQGIIDTTSSVIGLADESIFGSLQRKATLANGPVSLHSAAGKSADQTTPGKLIARIHSHLSERTFDTFMALVRHPAIESAISRSIESHREEPDESGASRPHAYWLKSLDLIRQDHVQTGAFQIPSGTRPKLAQDARAVHAAVNVLLNPLIEDDHAGSLDRSLDDWSLRLTQSIQLIYGDFELDPKDDHHQSIIEGLEAYRKISQEIEHARELGQQMPMLSAPAAIGLCLGRLGELPLAQSTPRDSIETLGWLELMLDPSPKCVVIGMNEASVPGSITHDPLLPGSLRKTLGMVTNEQRLARDTYLMSAINASRDASFVCARVGNQGDPITPSRLLLKARGSVLAHRVQRFVDPKQGVHELKQLTPATQPGLQDQFAKVLCIDQGYAPPTSMRVTDFDAYLRSPALWYLQRHRNLNDLDLEIRELSPPLLGNLVHAVFDAFGKDPSMRDLDDAGKINEALRHLLDECTRSQFGSKPPAAIQVQTHLLRYRLAWFAIEQSNRRRAGWSITHSEWSPPDSQRPVLMVDDEPMELRGKIDRIDTHEDGRIAIIDYKTGKLQDAHKAHFKKDRWMKLQLPLYRHLASELLDGRVPMLGYAGLPTKETDSVLDFADWSDEEFDSADEAARQVVREIRSLHAGIPVPLGDDPPQHGILGFISGQRFESGGIDLPEESELVEAEGSL